jgi:hypothetical protein
VLLESQTGVGRIQSCLSKYQDMSDLTFLRALAFGIMVTATTWAQTAQPQVADTEQRQNQSDDSPLPTVHTFPEVKGGANLAPQLAPPALPRSRVALIGGTVKEIDPIRNRMKVKVFGGGDVKVHFDSRSRVASEGEEIAPTKIRKGDRVYLDTQNVHGTLFARQVQINNKTVPGEVKGKVTDFDAPSGKLRIFDHVSGSEVALLVTPDTMIRLRDAATDQSRLQPGAFLSARYQPTSGQVNTAREIQVIVSPGESFRFLGTVRNLDLKAGFLAVENESDGTIYELRATPEEMRAQHLGVGAEVDIQAQFDGNDYVMQSLQRLDTSKSAEPDQQ